MIVAAFTTKRGTYHNGLPVWELAGSPTYDDSRGTVVAPKTISDYPTGMTPASRSTVHPQGIKALNGKPTETGTFAVQLNGEDALGNPAVIGTVSVTVEEPAPVTVTVGEPATVDLFTAAGSPSGELDGVYDLPPGMTASGDYKTLTGTPTTEGTYAVEIEGMGPLGDPYSAATVSVVVGAATGGGDDPDPGDGEPGDPGDGEPGDPGDGDPGTGYDPELEPFDLYDSLARSLAPRVAAFVGRPGDAPTIETAVAQLPVVTEYVRGFTRGRGFRDEAPAGPLRAVIVSGTARLATNPEQVAHFTTGDYSERPAQLAGWTLAELGVLRRYRRTSA